MTDLEAGVHNAAVNAVAVASVAYQQELARLRYVVTLAAGHGVLVGDIARAAGLNCQQIAGLISHGEL